MVSVNEFEQEAKEAAKSPWARRLARFGLIAKGITFGIVAVLALEVAFSGGGEIEDRPGALQKLAQNGLGRALLAALAIGLGCYALWRFAQAALGERLESEEDVVR